MTDWAQLMMSMDRCEHGRHAIDPCWSCPNGQSAGNPILVPGTHIGYDVYGRKIVIPEQPYDMIDPKNWIENGSVTS